MKRWIYIACILFSLPAVGRPGALPKPTLTWSVVPMPRPVAVVTREGEQIKRIDVYPPKGARVVVHKRMP